MNAEIILCPECGKDSLIEDALRGEIVCRNCGLVYSNIIDRQPEWRTFNSDDVRKKVRVGAPMIYSIPDKGLSTMIGIENTDASGKHITPQKKSELRRLRKKHIITKTDKSVDRNLSYAMKELGKISAFMNLTKETKETAAQIYRKMVKKKFIRGRSIEAMLIASLYTAAKLNNQYRLLKSFLEHTDVDKKRIARCYRLIRDTIRINIKPTSPIEFIPRFCVKLNIPVNLQLKISKILNLIRKYNFVNGKNPSGLTGAAIYIVATQNGRHRTQKEIAGVCGVTEATLRNGYHAIIKHLKFKIEV